MGTGEVTRYLGTYGSGGVSKAALFGVIPPFLLKTDDNPEGVPGEVFDGIKAAIVADRYAYFDDFFANFYNTDVLAPERIGDAALRASFQVAAGAGPYATYACVDTWLTDFRDDLPKIDVPTLVVHGTADRILPFEATAARLREEQLIADLTVVEVADGPHNIGWTHPEEVNTAFLELPAALKVVMAGVALWELPSRLIVTGRPALTSIGAIGRVSVGGKLDASRVTVSPQSAVHLRVAFPAPWSESDVYAE